MRVSLDKVVFGKGEVNVAMTFPWLSFLPETSLSQIFELEIHAYTIDVHKPIIMSFGLAQLREAAEKYTFHEGRLFGSWPCSWSFRRKKVQPSMSSSLVFFEIGRAHV